MFITVRCDTDKCYACENEDLNDPQHETTCMDQGSAAECDLVPSGTAVGFIRTCLLFKYVLVTADNFWCCHTSFICALQTLYTI